MLLYDTLIELLSQNEILTVLAYEAGHWKKKHIFKRIIFSQIVGVLFIYIGFRVLQSEWLVSGFQITDSSFFVKLYLVAFFSSIISFFQTPKPQNPMRVKVFES
jgi:STE24 endopeptidase